LSSFNRILQVAALSHVTLAPAGTETKNN